MSETQAKDSTVFIIQQPRPKGDGWMPDFGSARDYGKLEFVFDSGDKVYADPAAAALKVRTRLIEKFNPDKDFILCTNFGDPAAVWISTMALVAAGYKELRFLYWSKGRRNNIGSQEQDGFYIPITLDVKKICPL